MYKLLLIIPFYLVSTLISAQDCQYETDQTDKFDGTAHQALPTQTIYNTVNNGMNGHQTEALHITLAKNSETPKGYAILTVRYQRVAARSAQYCLTQEQSLSLRLDNGQVLVLANASDRIDCAAMSANGPPRGGNPRLVIHTISGFYTLNPDQAQQLLLHPITDIRIQFTDTRTDINLPQDEQRIKNPVGGLPRHGQKKINAQTYLMDNLSCVL